MIARRASALLFSLVLSSPAAAQIRALPAEAGTAPLTGLPAGPRASSYAPSLSVPSFVASLSGAPLVAAPFAPSAAEPSSIASAAAPVAALAAHSAAPSARAAAPELRSDADAVTISAAAAPAAVSFAAKSPHSVRETTLEAAALSAPKNLNALFDGRREAPGLPAAAAGPERASERARALVPSARLLGKTGRVLTVAVPIAALGGIALGVVSPHLAMAALHVLGQASYWVANPLAFLFTVPQIHRILSRRSAEVSTSMTAVGLFSALVTTLCFAFDGKDLMMYRNLAQTAGFAAMLGLQAKYARAAGTKAPSRTRALIETGAVVLFFGALLAFAGPVLMAAVPGIAVMSYLLVPFQILSGFGFTYMMYAQLRKMNLEHSAGDSSAGMMWAYLGTKVIWVWSFATMLSLVAAPAWLALAAGIVFAGVSWLATRVVLSRLLNASWSFIPEKISFRGRTLTRRALGDAGAFVVLAALILALSGVGHLAFASLLGITAGASSLFAMYLLYTVQNLVAAMATSKTLRLQAGFGQKALNPRP